MKSLKYHEKPQKVCYWLSNHKTLHIGLQLHNNIGEAVC